MPERARPCGSAYQSLFETLLSLRSSVTTLPPSAAWPSSSSTSLTMSSTPPIMLAYNDYLLLTHIRQLMIAWQKKKKIPLDDFWDCNICVAQEDSCFLMARFGYL